MYSASNPVKQCLNAYSLGKWDAKSMNWIRNDGIRPHHYHHHEIAEALRGKWIYIIGDSSCRMFMSALMEAVNGTLNDIRFGSYQYHNKGGCEALQDEARGNETIGCLREYINFSYSIRITFSFQAFFGHNLVFENLVSSSQKPDVILSEVGAWSLAYQPRPLVEIVNDASQFIQYLHSHQPESIFWLGLPSCPPFTSKVNSFDSLMETMVNKLGENVYYLNRQSSTVNLNQNHLCEGFHPFKHITLLHLQMLVSCILVTPSMKRSNTTSNITSNLV